MTFTTNKTSLEQIKKFFDSNDWKQTGKNKWQGGPDVAEKRYQKFSKPVHNLLKIVRKLSDFSALSEAYREKHMEVE